MCAAENLQRQNLPDAETIETIVEMVDVELIEDVEYAALGKKPVTSLCSSRSRLNSRIAECRCFGGCDSPIVNPQKAFGGHRLAGMRTFELLRHRGRTPFIRLHRDPQVPPASRTTE